MIFLVQFGINKHPSIFQRPQIALALRARVILLVFEKFTRAYLFQIALELYKLRHPLRALDLKAKVLIGHLWVSFIIDLLEYLDCYLFLRWVNSFLHCLQKNCTVLSQSESSNFFQAYY